MTDTLRDWAEALNDERLAHDLLELSKDIGFYGTGGSPSARRSGVEQRAAVLREAAWRIKGRPPISPLQLELIELMSEQWLEQWGQMKGVDIAPERTAALTQLHAMVKERSA